jgi:hypothetical protein
MSRPSAADVFAVFLFLVFAAACAAFTWQPGIASFADDSVSYLVMAQVLSPWQPASLPVAEAFAREAFYPPLFPALLALTGASHNIAIAHAVTSLLLAASIPLTYALGRRWLESRWAAAGAAAVVVLLPALWINAKGILSEPLYCVLLLATLLALEAQGERPERLERPWPAALLAAGLVLTRTAGFVLLAGYALWTLTRRDWSWRTRVLGLIPVLAAVLAYAAWTLMRPAGTSDDYLRILLERSQGLLSSAGASAIAAGLGRQANAVAEGWIGSVLLFWVEGRPVRVALAALIGALALGGMLLRIRAGKVDGWIMAAYLATFLVWPFYDQMGRFLFPALPVLVLYAFLAAGAALRALGRRATAGYALLGFLVASLALPGLAFIHQRFQAAGREAEIVDWYRSPDLAEARARARVHLDLFADMDAIRQATPPGARVMWVAPSYLALLAERRGIPAPAARDPAAYREAARDARADYIFVSAYHPRDTLSRGAWLAGMEAMNGHAEIVRSHVRGDGVVTSVLFKVAPLARVAPK